MWSHAIANCDPCAIGKLGAAGFANFEGCDTTQARILINYIEKQPANQVCLDVWSKEHEDAINACKDLGTKALETAQCLIHTGGKGWVVALTTALTYTSLLPLAIVARPSMAIKCD